MTGARDVARGRFHELRLNAQLHGWPTVLRRQFRWWWTCRVRRKYPMEVYRTISPQIPPPRAVERLRQRVLSGKWD